MNPSRPPQLHHDCALPALAPGRTLAAREHTENPPRRRYRSRFHAAG